MSSLEDKSSGARGWMAQETKTFEVKLSDLGTYDGRRDSLKQSSDFLMDTHLEAFPHAQ